MLPGLRSASTTLARARLVSVAMGALAFVCCIPLLATSPQNGDGLELVRVVDSGGALHPPGFPLQALLDRVVAWLPWSTVAWRLSLLSALAHGLAVACVAEAAGRLSSTEPRDALTPRIVAGALFAWSPAVWALAVQPEVFAVAHACFAALVLFAVVVDVEADAAADAARSQSGLRARAAALGALVGVAAASHPITVLAAPFFVLALARLVRHRATWPSVFALAGGTFVVVVVATYATLVLPSRAPWPAWGDLHTVADVVRHALRADYGGALAMSAAAGGASTSALDVLAHDARAQPVVAVVIVALGAFGVVGARGALRLAWGATTALTLVVAARAAIPAPFDDAVAVVERMLGPVWLVLAIGAGAGAGRLAALLPPRGARAVAVVGALTIASAVVVGAPVVDASADHTLDVVVRAEGIALPDDALFIVAEDTECMGGAMRPDGTRRDAVCGGALGLPWYVARLSQVEPRLPAPVAAGGTRAVVAWARERGLVVASPHDELLAGAGPLSARGPLVFVGDTGEAGEAREAAVRTAVDVCPLLAVLEPLPRGRHAFTEGQWWNIARGFDAAAFALGDGDAGRHAHVIADGLRAGVDPATWRDGCARFVRALAPVRARP